LKTSTRTHAAEAGNDAGSDVTVEVGGVSRYYGSHAAVREISLTLRRGEVLGLLGPNGAGKTTTMQMITGNLAPSAGSIAVCGIDMIDRPVEAKRHVGYLPEHPPLYRELTVDEYLRLAGRLHRVDRSRLDEAIASARHRCGIADAGRRLIGTLSKGFQQRVGIAQAILHDPDVVILDEPTVGLDPNQIREIRALIRELRIGRSVILSTHILPEVESVCDRVEIMHHGRFVFSDRIEALERPAGGGCLQVALRQPPAPDVLAGLPGVTGVEQVDAQVFRLSWSQGVDPTDALVERSVRDGWGLYGLGPAHHRIEDVFVRLTQQENTP